MTSEVYPRVLHVTEASLGGVRRYMENILDATKDSPLEQAFAYSLERCDGLFPDLVERMHAQGWSLFEIPMKREIDPESDARSLIELRRIIKYFHPDVLHLHSSKAGALGRLAVKLSRAHPAVVYSPHAIAASIGRIYHGVEWILGHGSTDLFVAVSSSERAELIELGVARENQVEVVYPAIDAEVFKPLNRAEAREAIGIAIDVPLVLGIGRLTAQKDPTTFVRIVGEIASHMPTVRAIWVGEGELREQVSHSIEAMDLGHAVELVGWQPDVRPYIAAANLVLMTSRYESFGYVTAESLAMGIPVIATEVTGTTDILEIQECLFPNDDWVLGAKKAEHLLLDPGYSKMLAQRGNQRVRDIFAPAVMGKALLAVYTRLI